MASVTAGLRDALRRPPPPLPYHPLFRFYEGGALTRSFRGLPDRPDDWWPEDWVGSCTCAGNADPDGRVQGLSMVELPGAGPVTLRSVVEAWPAEMLGSSFSGEGQTGVLVKLLSRVAPGEDRAARLAGRPAPDPGRGRRGGEAARRRGGEAARRRT
ncbi:MAG: hypothetical protein ACRDPY_11295 [Streptosporangiaceae bacterium]